VLPLARNLNVLTVRLASSLSCAVHPDLLMTFFNSLLELFLPGKGCFSLAAAISMVDFFRHTM